MFMKLKQPGQIRTLFAEKKKWLTIGEIADGLDMHRNTVSKFLKGQPIDVATARSIAEAVGVDVMSIAEFVN